MKKYILSFLRKEAVVSDDIKVMGSSFQIVGETTEKTRLLLFSPVLRTKSFCEIDDLKRRHVPPMFYEHASMMI